MNIFNGRYFFLACILAMSVSVISFFVLPVVKLIIGLVAIVLSMVAMLIYIFKRSTKGPMVIAIMFCLAMFVSAFSSFIAFDAGFMLEREIIGKQVEVQAIVLDEEYHSDNMSGYLVRVEKVNGDNKSFKAILECSYVSEVHRGDRIIAHVTAADFENNLGGYAEKQSRLSDGVFMSLESYDEDSYEIIEENVDDIKVVSKGLAYKLSYKLREAIGGEEGNLAAAMLLGERQYLSDTTVRDYSRSGASHYLALSGMHMAIVMGVLTLILKLFSVPKIPRAVLLIIVAVSYYVLTGMSMSATRSLIMLLWVYIGMILSFKSDTLTNLSFAGAAILVISPFAVADVAFWMSFAATFGIVVFMEIPKEIFERMKSDNKLVRIIKRSATAVIGSFATAIFALLGLVIVISIFTKEYAIYSVISSVALSLPSVGIILFSLLLPFFSFIPPIRELLISGIRKCGGFCLDACSDISAKENVIYSIDYDFLVYFAVAFAVVLLISLMIKLTRKHYVLLMYIPIIAAFVFTVNIVSAKNASKIDVTYLNTSSRSDIIVATNNGDAVILDFSNGSQSAFSSALEVVDNSRVSEVEAIMLSDYHTAHISTLSKIFKRRMVRQIWLPEPVDEDSYYRMLSIIEVARENNVKARMYNLEDNLYAFGELKVTLDQSYLERSTVPVSVMSVECNDSALVYFSPSYVECDDRQDLENVISRADYLIAGARGPKVKKYYSVGSATDAKEIAIPEIAMAIYLDTQQINEDLSILINSKDRSYTFHKAVRD